MKFDKNNHKYSKNHSKMSVNYVLFIHLPSVWMTKIGNTGNNTENSLQNATMAMEREWK